jgi:NADPH2:quinone reductase
MKAVVCQAWGLPDTLAVQDLPDPQAGPGQVVIDVKAAGVNFPDVLIVQGKYQFKPELPFIPGSEVAGVIRSVADDVTTFKPGDKVIAFTSVGGFGQQLAAPVHALMPMPPDMDFDVAAAITLTYGTSHHAVVDRGRAASWRDHAGAGRGRRRGPGGDRDRQGARRARDRGASSDEKLEVCKQHGADVLINYSTQDLRERSRRPPAARGRT